MHLDKPSIINSPGDWLSSFGTSGYRHQLSDFQPWTVNMGMNALRASQNCCILSSCTLQLSPSITTTSNMEGTIGSLADPQYPIAQDPELEDDELCKRCLTISRDFSKEELNGILFIGKDIEEWEASSCKLCVLIRFAVGSQKSWSRVRIDLTWFPYGELQFPRQASDPKAIGILILFNRNLRDFTEDGPEITRCSEDDDEQPVHEQRCQSVNFQLLKRWLSNCDTKHRLCSPQAHRSLSDSELSMSMSEAFELHLRIVTTLRCTTYGVINPPRTAIL